MSEQSRYGATEPVGPHNCNKLRPSPIPPFQENGDDSRNGGGGGGLGLGCGGYVYKRWFGIRRSTVLFWLYIVTYALFLFGGSVIIAWLESGNEIQLRQEMIDLKTNFLNKHKGVNRSEVESLLEAVLYYSSRGISVLDRHHYTMDDESSENWSYGQSLLFTVTVVTTIGYGHVTPLTESGKLFCILFAMLGIPFTLIFLSAAVQRLLGPTCHILAYLFAKYGSRISTLSIRLMHLSFMAIIFLIFFVFMPAAVFAALENGWNFVDGIYYVFISLTTIGLGDYIPGDGEHQNHREIYKVAVAVYLLLGLVFMTLTATIFYDIPQLNLGLVLHQQKDIHMAEEVTTISEVEDENTSIREAMKRHMSPKKSNYSSSDEALNHVEQAR